MRSILITGGTSGLGLEITRLYSEMGMKVFVTGRDPDRLKEIRGDINFVYTDFSDIKTTALTISRLFSENKISLLINNAGILSPPEKIVTADGYEYTFQVNFLVPLLISELFLRHSSPDCIVTIASVISPVYTLAARKKLFFPGKEYRPLSEYALSKLNLARLSSILTDRHKNLDVRFLSYNPGTFESSIHRMQRGYFRGLYALASGMMTNPATVARGLVKVLDSPGFENNSIVNRYGKVKRFIEPEPGGVDQFRKEIFSIFSRFLSE